MCASLRADPDASLRPLDRWRALDLLRLVAVVLMVQGHVFTALLDPGLREDAWYPWHSYVHGLTAPIFFFSSGLAFGVATLRHWSSHTHWGPPIERRFERYGWLLFIGYMLSLPKLSFSQLVGADGFENARTFFKVDALENIAVSLIIVQGLVWLLERQRLFITSVTLLGGVLVFAAPAVWRLPVEAWLPIGVASYVNINTGSIFPLFPWTGFLCAGVVTAYLSLDARGSLRQHRALALTGVGLGVWTLAHQLQESGVNFFGEHDYWKTNPVFFFTRLGLIFLGFATLCAYEAIAAYWRRRGPREPRPDEPGFLERVSQETLVVYVAHLFLLYGSPINPGLTRLLGRSLTIEAASIVAMVILLVSTAIALLWRRTRERRGESFRRLQFGLAACVLLVALFKP